MPVRTCAREPPRRRHTRAAKHWRSCERWARTRSLARGRRNLPRHFALSPDASSTVPVSRSGFASLQRCMWRMCCMCWQCAPTATAPRRVGCEGTQCSATGGARPLCSGRGATYSRGGGSDRPAGAQGHGMRPRRRRASAASTAPQLQSPPTCPTSARAEPPSSAAGPARACHLQAPRHTGLSPSHRSSAARERQRWRARRRERSASPMRSAWCNLNSGPHAPNTACSRP